jgi:folate-binding protein YgfZ
MELAADQYDKLLAHLDRFIIMDDVELVPLEQTALGLTGPASDAVLARLGLPALPEPLTTLQTTWNGFDLRLVRAYGVLAPHYELWVQPAEIPALWTVLKEAGALPVGTASLDALRLAEGIPAYGVDMVERDLPQETSQMRALHFAKGCYLGQEIVERIRSRGSVHRHLRQLELDGPLPEAGCELSFQNAAGAEASAGQITSAVELHLASGSRRLALGMMRGEAELRIQPFTYTVGAASGSARILTAPPSLNP